MGSGAGSGQDDHGVPQRRMPKAQAGMKQISGFEPTGLQSGSGVRKAGSHGGAAAMQHGMPQDVGGLPTAASLAADAKSRRRHRPGPRLTGMGARGDGAAQAASADHARCSDSTGWAALSSGHQDFTGGAAGNGAAASAGASTKPCRAGVRPRVRRSVGPSVGGWQLANTANITLDQFKNDLSSI